MVEPSTSQADANMISYPWKEQELKPQFFIQKRGSLVHMRDRSFTSYHLSSLISHPSNFHRASWFHHHSCFNSWDQAWSPILWKAHTHKRQCWIMYVMHAHSFHAVHELDTHHVMNGWMNEWMINEVLLACFFRGSHESNWRLLFRKRFRDVECFVHMYVHVFHAQKCLVQFRSFTK